jgi:hypothetical protein
LRKGSARWIFSKFEFLLAAVVTTYYLLQFIFEFLSVQNQLQSSLNMSTDAIEKCLSMAAKDVVENGQISKFTKEHLVYVFRAIGDEDKIRQYFSTEHAEEQLHPLMGPFIHEGFLSFQDLTGNPLNF